MAIVDRLFLLAKWSADYVNADTETLCQSPTIKADDWPLGHFRSRSTDRQLWWLYFVKLWWRRRRNEKKTTIANPPVTVAFSIAIHTGFPSVARDNFAILLIAL